MRLYDALRAPKAEEWLALDESEQLDVVREYHSRAGIGDPKLRLHIPMHCVIETQVALGEESPVGATMARLQMEGLDRHEAVHAIGSVLAEQLHIGICRSLDGVERLPARWGS